MFIFVFVIQIISLFIIVMGITGIFSPEAFTSFISIWRSAEGLWSAVVVRFIFGLSLWCSASCSKTPLIFKILGSVTLISAVILPFFGVSHLHTLISRISSLPPYYIKGLCLVPLAIGSFIFWSVFPKKKID